ncbi:hypothetical protein PRIC2_007032 [Phytophthora ramorum]
MCTADAVQSLLLHIKRTLSNEVPDSSQRGFLQRPEARGLTARLLRLPVFHLRRGFQPSLHKKSNSSQRQDSRPDCWRRISSQSLKRKASDADEGDNKAEREQQQQETKKLKTQTTPEPTAESESDYLPTDIEEDEEVPYEHPQSETRGAADGPGCVAMDATADVECSSESPRRRSLRTLYVEYWSRTDECKERKWDHLDEIAENYGSAEEHIFATTLKGRTAFLEPNMFPYDTPAGIEHWTLWHVKDLNHEQVKQYVENWIDANAPHVQRWNYDDNPERSIDIFHVHVYFQVAEGLTVLQGRKQGTGRSRPLCLPSTTYSSHRRSSRVLNAFHSSEARSESSATILPFTFNGCEGVHVGKP